MLTVLTAVVLAWTVMRGVITGDIVWKSSLLPLVYYGDRIVVVERNGEEGKGLCDAEQPFMGLKEMKADSKRVRVVF